jgi:hypothetical protein
MIEVKVPGLRLTGFSGHNAAVAKGSFMYKAGEFVAADHQPLDTPGYASAGDIRMLPATDWTHSGFGVFPVNKLILQTEGADQGLDTIVSGVSLIYYVGGQFETDEYDVTVSGTGTLKGAKLYLNATGQITLTAKANWGLPPIGEVVNVSAFPATARWFNAGNTSGVNSFKKTVWYELYPWHANAAGNAMFR